MPAFNFKKQFVPLVVSGKKRQTIRAKRKHPICRGQIAYCYQGMRTKQCLKLGEWPIVAVHDIDIYDHGVFVDGIEVQSRPMLNILARADGFQDWPEMENWFVETHGLPFYGTLIMW